MRPTGPLHLGHLFGALETWVKLQDEYECLFMVADWHALMSEYQDPSYIQGYILDNVIDWLATGIDPQKSTIFIQSDVKEHLELFIIFSVITPLGLLERCPTYKEQLRELSTRELNTYGFLGYPVLQAADILVYKAESVPVGEDQLPHLELTQDIAQKFNHLFGTVFPMPKPILTKTPRLLGIDGRKMSKSYGNFIALGDSEELIRQKVLSMFTDPRRIKMTDPGHPDICNVYHYYKKLKSDYASVVYDYCSKAKKGCVECKTHLAEIIVGFLSDFRNTRARLLKDKERIYQILKEGGIKVQKIASQTITEVKKAVGLV